uniref:Uncharacterized protein n=1 Tax=Romanomermis culicivorax TaxID=13658 RepID=A0A915HRZ5_ROMCU
MVTIQGPSSLLPVPGEVPTKGEIFPSRLKKSIIERKVFRITDDVIVSEPLMHDDKCNDQSWQFGIEHLFDEKSEKLKNIVRMR